MFLLNSNMFAHSVSYVPMLVHGILLYLPIVSLSFCHATTNATFMCLQYTNLETD